MASKSNLVNLDAMILREDFATEAEEEFSSDSFRSFSVKDFDLYSHVIKKPDFQRETNQWSPQQVASLISSYVSGDLIPSVILWKGSYIFVIDGGHRLSALRAWVLDDYGDASVSQKFFNYQIPKEQLESARKTRELVEKNVGSWQGLKDKISSPDATPEEKRKISKILTQALTIQWVSGDEDKAEVSFFNINMKGTPLDDVEEFLLKNRKKPTSIAARAVIRAGFGHKYWSKFDAATAKQIETYAKKIHSIAFDPDIQSPVKTLELPLGGSRGVRVAIQLLIDFIEAATYGVGSKVVEAEDNDGLKTINCLRQSIKLFNRITGNDRGSLGLHPAVYFYGPSGRHSSPMFLGTSFLIAKHIRNNNKKFFSDFISIRESLEKILIEKKDLIALIIQKVSSRRRSTAYMDIIEKLIIDLLSGKTEISDDSIVKYGGFTGKVLNGVQNIQSSDFSDDVKSEAFINAALKGCIKCDICSGYIDASKSISYDHDGRKRDGGVGSLDNCRLTHPYCNQAVKN
ncbi:DUF262 domain-containing protein (plasmid) [Klebsiella pneumoniae]|nr:DUF262 domain-containing protein [Klebsiella quasipneumoniae subsp. quasipneumoniae]HBR4055198.1 DUF262 domain-containing protein [Klebsiella pneumoniae]HBZ0904879.1 DUF262 domain-containing protein [Klebsiella pneumoniae]